MFYSSYLFSTHIFVLDGVLCFIASMLISSEYHSFSLSSVFYHLYHGMHTHTHTHAPPKEETHNCPQLKLPDSTNELNNQGSRNDAEINRQHTHLCCWSPPGSDSVWSATFSMFTTYCQRHHKPHLAPFPNAPKSPSMMLASQQMFLDLSVCQATLSISPAG